MSSYTPTKDAKAPREASSPLESSSKHEFFLPGSGSIMGTIESGFNPDSKHFKKTLVRRRGEGISGWWVGKGPR